MDTRPKKRQKKLVALSSDEDDERRLPKATTEENARCSKYTKAQTGNGRIQQSLPARPRVKATAEPKKRPTTSKSSPSRLSKKIAKDDGPKAKCEKDRERLISKFFSTKRISQQSNGRTEQPAASAEEAPPEMPHHGHEEGGEEDAIEDDSPLEQIEELRAVKGTTRRVLDRRKQTDKVPAAKRRPPNASQRFMIPTNGPAEDIAMRKDSRSEEPDGRPWAERYGPTNLEELAVHKRKVTDVRIWLENALFAKDRKRLLVLKGPSGAGKTATLDLLAKSMNAELSEWKNPVGSDFSSEGYSSMSAQFDDFLGRSGKYGKLDFCTGGLEPTLVASSTSEANSEARRRKIIVLEEFPNTFLSTSVALCSFRSCIMEYLTVNTLSRIAVSDTNNTAVVMIITETRLATTAAASDIFTAYRLLGSDILSHPGVSVVEFNPVATTFITKALELVLQKEARHSGRRRIPGPSVLRRLGEVGDIRSAIGSLEFLCVGGNDGDHWGSRIAAKGKKGVGSSESLTKMEEESLRMVTQREVSLGLFHAVGKVVYNKRDETTFIGSNEPYTVQPPQHISGHARVRMPQVSIDHLIDETGTDTGTFIAALHENYVMSCEGPSFVDSLNECLDALSDTDILSSPLRGRFRNGHGHARSAFQQAAANGLMHDELSFQVAVRGLLFALPDPVRRPSHPIGLPGRLGGKADAYKMFFPTSMKLGRQMEEVDSLVDRWVSRLQSGTIAGSQVGQRRSVTADAKLVPTLDSSITLAQESHFQEPCRINLYVTRSELIVERLPYFSKIQLSDNSSPYDRELQSITQFHGISVPDDSSMEEEDGVGDMSVTIPDWTTDKPIEVANMRAMDSGPATQDESGVGSKRASSTTFAVEERVEKLYLSEDDIEDD